MQVVPHLLPIVDRFPLGNHLCQGQVQQFHRGFLRRKRTASLDDLAQTENAEKVCGDVVFTKRNQDTLGRDIEEMIAAKLKFDEAITGAKLPIMAKQRLKIVQRDLFEQLRSLRF